LAEAVKEVEDEKSLSNVQFIDLLDPSLSLGGARPKASVLWGGKPHIVKFKRQSDFMDNALLEQASFLIARVYHNCETSCFAIFSLFSPTSSL
jgi:hypothetical protein